VKGVSVKFREDNTTETNIWRSQAAPSRTFNDSAGVTWEVVEVPSADVPGSQGERSLLFLSAEVARRVWNYPADWWSLNPKELEALSWMR
jgi:hypothetical protein